MGTVPLSPLTLYYIKTPPCYVHLPANTKMTWIHYQHGKGHKAGFMLGTPGLSESLCKVSILTNNILRQYTVMGLLCY